ncbi:MAG: biopolymer transporter ExbD [Bacteroidota bacterium]
MKLFKSKSDCETEISTSALPDIVFLLLFFFMVSSTIREDNQDLVTQIPKANFSTKASEKSLVKELIVGFPISNDRSEPQISTGSRIINSENLVQWVEEERNTLPESQKNKMIVLIKADENIEMGLIGDIQEQLRKANARKVIYRALDKL